MRTSEDKSVHGVAEKSGAAVLAGFVTGLVVGFASTPHCLGMCGGLPLHFARGAKGWQVGLRPLLFVAGKSFTYAFLGALAGFAGHAIVQSGVLSEAGRLLGYSAGAVMVAIGLGMLGLRLPRRLRAVRAQEWSWVSSIYRDFFASPGSASSLYGGVAAGFLPCPVTLMLLAPAIALHDVPTAMAIMTGLGLGTGPGLIAAGLLGTALAKRLSVVGLRGTGAVVLAVGVALILRAAGTLCSQQAACHHPTLCRPGGVTRAPSETAHARPGL